MRKVLVILLFTLALNAADSYCIQVLNTSNQASITKAFMAKVRAYPLPYQQEYSEGSYKLFVGKFPTYEEAATHLADVREKISQDAFISMQQDAVALEPETKMQQMKVLAQAKLLKFPKVQAKEEPKIPVPKEPEPQQAKMPEAQSKPVIVQRAKKDEPKHEGVFCKPSKKALREAEIAEALSFYRNSSYYSFN